MSHRNRRLVAPVIVAVVVGAVAAAGIYNRLARYPAIDASDVSIFENEVLRMEMPRACTVTVRRPMDVNMAFLTVKVENRDVMGISLNVIPESRVVDKEYHLDTREGVLKSNGYLNGHYQETVTWSDGDRLSRWTLVEVYGDRQWPAYASLYYYRIPRETAAVADKIIASIRFREIEPKLKKR